MKKVLVLEDNRKVWETYIQRILPLYFEKSVPGQYEFSRVATLETALHTLLAGGIDVAILDYQIQKHFKCETEKGSIVLKTGADLAKLLRAVNTGAFLIGMGNNPMETLAMKKNGCFISVEKHQLERMLILYKQKVKHA